MLGSIVIIVAGFSVNKYVFSSKVYDGVTTVTDIVAIYPVNIFDFKQTLQITLITFVIKMRID